jgi:hypothetical protein
VSLTANGREHGSAVPLAGIERANPDLETVPVDLVRKLQMLRYRSQKGFSVADISLDKDKLVPPIGLSLDYSDVADFGVTPNRWLSTYAWLLLLRPHNRSSTIAWICVPSRVAGSAQEADKGFDCRFSARAGGHEGPRG